MKEFIVILILVPVIGGYGFAVKVSRDISKITRNNQQISNYRRHKDSYVKQLARDFQNKDDMKWKEMGPYVKESNSLIKQIENHIKNQNYGKS